MSRERCEELFETMVEATGVKAFAADMGLSARQVYRMLNGVQPNPIWRFCQALTAARDADRSAVLDFICQQHAGYFARPAVELEQSNVNAVKESAEAIVAISEGRSPNVTIREIREAVAALCALEGELTGRRESSSAAGRPVG